LPDGDEAAWYDRQRTVCSHPACVGQYEAERKQAQRGASRPRRTSAEVHAAILEERRLAAARCRATAKQRGLIREKGAAA
jgi:hypothetical protein